MVGKTGKIGNRNIVSVLIAALFICGAFSPVVGTSSNGREVWFTDKYDSRISEVKEGTITTEAAQGDLIVAHVFDGGEPVKNVEICLPEQGIYATTDERGIASITIPEGKSGTLYLFVDNTKTTLVVKERLYIWLSAEETYNELVKVEEIFYIGVYDKKGYGLRNCQVKVWESFRPTLKELYDSRTEKGGRPK